MALELSPRERETIAHIAEGRTTKEIAAELSIAESTVNWHVSNALTKLGASTRAEAVAIALKSDARALPHNRGVTSFMDVVGEVRATAKSAGTAAAIRLLEEQRSAYPRHLGLSYLIEAELRAGGGEGPAALAVIERALGEGCRYRTEWLLDNEALMPIARSDLEALAERAQRAYDEAAARAKPTLMFAMPDTLPDAFGYPLLMVLHGNHSNAKVTAPQWTSVADRGWVVAVPQSAEIGATPDAFTWNDRARVAAELDSHFEKVKRATEIDTSRTVLAGFSAGGAQALALALQRRFVVRGVIAVAPWLPRIDELAALVAGGAGKMLRVYIVMGVGDPSLATARDLVGLMERRNVRVSLDERAGLAHDYPEDMDATLARAVEFVSK